VIQPAISAAPTREPPRQNTTLALTAICLGFLLITLDATIVNVALGPIIADLGGSVSGAQWVVSGYTIAFASLLLSAGALADRIGARAGYAIGLIVFALGSTLCALAVSLPMLLAFRVIQGIGAAWLMPCSLALIGHTFTAAHHRRRALAIWGGASGIGLASGPLAGGLLTTALGWRTIFLVNVPLAAVCALLLVRHVPETRRQRHDLDPPGQALAILALATLTAGLIVAGRRGWTSGAPVGLLGVGALALLGFVTAERRSTGPMVEPALLRLPQLRIAVAIGLIFNFCLYGGLFCLALDLQRTFALDSLDAGLALLPVTLLTGLTAYLSGNAVKRFGEWRAMLSGLGAGVFAGTLVALTPSSAGVGALIGASAPLGLTALAMPSMTAVAIGSAPAERIGLASGLLNAARQTGGALGVAFLGALLGHDGISLRAAFSMIACLYAVGCVLARRGLSHHASVHDPPVGAFTRWGWRRRAGCRRQSDS
jgi:DHA2 family methylenomycin A resistance protein-like MFS transporter